MHIFNINLIQPWVIVQDYFIYLVSQIVLQYF
jgi:hypothetical protein